MLGEVHGQRGNTPPREDLEMMVDSIRPRSVIASYLAKAMGEESADETVRDVANELDVGPDEFTAEQALLILEEIAQRPGLVGITARYAKARVHIRWRDR